MGKFELKQFLDKNHYFRNVFWIIQIFGLCSVCCSCIFEFSNVFEFLTAWMPENRAPILLELIIEGYQNCTVDPRFSLSGSHTLSTFEFSITFDIFIFTSIMNNTSSHTDKITP
ncbi:hypothetical protein NECAME_09701 [Necator americanus]|uniref:Uncharacterized protein n=1 Tax=Necator americanus TaxID=51031 RepID=W2TC73_NECAM|nr:hypothetical protein NECAME_09701 [Necator americanus]ETN79655.1 hypothetical protein NECAME_09701 [Necator americanus]